MMKLPYNCLQVCGNVLLAARGGSIHSFNIVDGSYIASWKHPDEDHFLAAAQAADSLDAENGGSTPASHSQPDLDLIEQPPAKRQRLTSNVDEDTPEVSILEASEAQNEEEDAIKDTKRKNGPQRKRWKHRTAISNVPDRPIVSLMVATQDNGHIVAVTSHDKAILVFEHDGDGHLKELSKR
jgi:tRNA (guanine-N(7)-)-methyltransferase subunit TRM82